mmetsp:Transcript_12559/g.17908  ORF Transcript_12559/g.17908 Transcript_12559/m.17908 type:complete len:246 (+) Transcript_12559:51-788(+)
MDGIDLLHTLRSSQRLGVIPVVLLTAKSLTEDRIRGYRAGADAYLPKPFDPNELLAIVDNLVQRYSVQRSSSSSSYSSDNKRYNRNKDINHDSNHGSNLLPSSTSPSSHNNNNNPTPPTPVNNNRDLKVQMGHVKDLLRQKKSMLQSQSQSQSQSSSQQPRKSTMSLPSSTSLSQSKVLPHFTPSERQVLELLCKGYTNAEIAHQRGNASAAAVGRIVSRLYDKTHTNSRTELLTWALKLNIIVG